MPSTISRLNKEISKQIFRSVGWISIFYFLGLLFCVPLSILMSYSTSGNSRYPKVISIFQYSFGIQLLLMVVVPIVLSVFLFRFLHVKQATDLMHSLPLKREKIFHHYALTGVLFLVLPVVVVGIITMILHVALNLASVYTMKMVIVWVGLTILMNLLFYASGVFVAMVTGISAVQAVLTYILLFFPVAMALILFFNMKILLYGFPLDSFINQDLYKMSPITYATNLQGGNMQAEVLVVYGVLALVFYVLGLFLYKKRKHESVSEAIAFPNLHSVFKYGTTFCFMLAGGMYFSLLTKDSFSWIMFGYVIGTLFGYFISEMVLQKTWRVFTRLKGLGIFSLAVIILLLGIKFLAGYEETVPALNEVRSVLLTDNSNAYANPNDPMAKYSTAIPMTRRENIEAVRKFHLQIIADHKLNRKLGEEFTQNAYLTYQLKNGETIRREYKIEQKLYTDLLKPIYESEEYKRNTYEIFKIDENKVKSLSITPNGPVARNLVISESADIKKAIQAIREDLLEESYADSLYFQSRGLNLELRLGKTEFINTQIQLSYPHFKEWLKEKGWLDRTSTTASDIDYILIGKNHGLENRKETEILRDLKQQADSLKITDPSKIQLAIDQSSRMSDKYIAYCHYKIDEYTEILFFDDQHAPDFVKNHFK